MSRTGEDTNHALLAIDAIADIAVLEKLTAAVDEVATVYAGLLEVSATARTIGVSLDETDVCAVNDAVALLQMAFADLEADAASLPSDGAL